MDNYTIISLVLLVIAFWQKKTWIFFVAGTALMVTAIFGFKDNASNTIGWAFAWVESAMALGCIISQLWMREEK